MNGLTKPRHGHRVLARSARPCDAYYEFAPGPARTDAFRARSLSTGLDTHPAAKAGLVAATALGLATTLRSRAS